MNAVILQESLKLCLLNKTDCWYTEKLSHLIRVDLQNDNKDVEEWCKTLKTKFLNLFSCELLALKLLHYTINDVWCWKDFIDYIQNIVLYRKNINIIINDCLQMFLIYEHINDKLCLHLSS